VKGEFKMNSDIDFKNIWNKLSNNEKVAISVLKNYCQYGTSYVCYEDYTPYVLKKLGYAEDADRRAINGTMIKSKKVNRIRRISSWDCEKFSVTQLGINVMFYNLMSIDKFIETIN